MSIYRFEGFELDAENFRISRDGNTIAAEPMVIDLLLEFARNPDRLLSRDDLIASVWDGRFVSDSTVSTAVKSARRILGDSGEEQKFIKTVRGRGFQFVSPVTSDERAPASAITRPISVQPALYIHLTNLEKALSAVEIRAFGNRLRTILNRMPLLRIAVPLAGFDSSTDPRRLHSEHGVTHFADVTLYRDGSALYADAALVETRTGLQKWARNFQVENVTGSQEVLLHKIIAHFEPAMMKSMIETLSGKESEPDPQALILEAIGTMSVYGWNRSSFQKACGLLNRAIAKDDQIAIAHAYAALIRALRHRVGINRDPGEREAAIRYAETALSLETQDSFVLGITGCALCDAGQLERGFPILQRSAELDPSNGHALTAIGAALLMKGDFPGAVEKLRAGIEISPADSRLAVWEALLGMAELICGRLDEALQATRTATSRDDSNYLSRLALSAVLAAKSDGPGLNEAIGELLRVHPDLTENEVLYFVGPDLKEAIWPQVEAHRRTN